MTERTVEQVEPVERTEQAQPAHPLEHVTVTGTRTLRIALWGPPASGRTTMLGVLRQAAETMPASRWRVRGDDFHTREFLQAADNATIDERRFPGVEAGGNEYTYLFSRRARAARWDRRPDRPRFRAVLLDLPDLCDAAPDRAPAALAECAGLIYLFDPVSERDSTHEAAFERFVELLDEAPALPSRLAICVTKIDATGVFAKARSEGWVELDRRGRVRITDPRRYYEWLSGTGGTYAGRARAGLLRDLDLGRFPRTRHYATSATGFRTDAADRVNPDQCRTVDSLGALEAPPRPQGVVEPILDMYPGLATKG